MRCGKTKTEIFDGLRRNCCFGSWYLKIGPHEPLQMRKISSLSSSRIAVSVTSCTERCISSSEVGLMSRRTWRWSSCFWLFGKAQSSTVASRNRGRLYCSEGCLPCFFRFHWRAFWGVRGSPYASRPRLGLKSSRSCIVEPQAEICSCKYNSCPPQCALCHKTAIAWLDRAMDH